MRERGSVEMTPNSCWAQSSHSPWDVFLNHESTNRVFLCDLTDADHTQNEVVTHVKASENNKQCQHRTLQSRVQSDEYNQQNSAWMEKNNIGGKKTPRLIFKLKLSGTFTRSVLRESTLPDVSSCPLSTCWVNVTKFAFGFFCSTC